MIRRLLQELAKAGHRAPIGTDLVLKEKPDHEEIILSGQRLGRVMEEAARKYHTPLAVPLMDLTLEKDALLHLLSVPKEERNTFHFHGRPEREQQEKVEAEGSRVRTPRMEANLGAIRYIAEQTDLTPLGMLIGPFSLMTKLIADPIGAVYMAGTGVTGAEDPEVAAIESALAMGQEILRGSVMAQAAAGAKAIIVCEPAANLVFFSPRQLKKGSDVFERFVMTPSRRLRAELAEAGVELIFHDCGELMDEMVTQFTTLDPVMISLGSSRNLWEDAARVPNEIVLFGNLPSKRFYSDDLVTLDGVKAATCELLGRMSGTGHPYILGSECDVLSVEGSHDTIAAKVDAFLTCSC